MEIEAWTGLGGSWGRPWDPFGLPRPSGTEKRSQMTKNDRVWAPILGSIFDMFRYFSMLFRALFYSLRVGGYQDRFLVDFIGFWDQFKKFFFIIFWIVGK